MKQDASKQTKQNENIRDITVALFMLEQQRLFPPTENFLSLFYYL